MKNSTLDVQREVERLLYHPVIRHALEQSLSRPVDAKQASGGSVSSEDLESAIQGDPYAVEALLRWIRPLVLRYCRSRIGGQEKIFASADDVAQEVCLAVLTALPSYRDQGRPFLAFVYGIAGHKVADARRSAARNRAEPVAEVPEAVDPAEGPEARVVHGEFAGRMARLLESVSDRQRDILHLRVVVGLSVEETAEAVGSTPGAVRVAQHRALNRLRAVLMSKDYVAHHVQTNTHTKPIGDDLPELDDLLAAADRALRQKLRTPGGISFEVCGIESADDEYIDQLLQIADVHLRNKIGMSGVECSESV